MALPSKTQLGSRSKTKRDESVIGTNNSSIVSKRSVERLYYPEPHFFRYFVKKPQRRSPLINRGYWLRMYAIDSVVKCFLEKPTERPKVVVSLGCGYDPLPFQWLSKAPVACGNTIFVDVDYPQLILKKCHIISDTPQLAQLVGPNRSIGQENALLYESPQYVAVGCDLTDIQRLDDILNQKLHLANCMVLCTAEVSVTYMNAEAANALIKWVARYENVQFCLLEQYLPHSADHPFAKQMINHFDNLQTPLKSIHRYPRICDQEKRFRDLGWSTARARSLWGLWYDPYFLSPEQRLALDKFEPFDEWEDFALFASHYFLLEASNMSDANITILNSNEGKGEAVAYDQKTNEMCVHDKPQPFKLKAFHRSYSNIRRRLGATFNISPGVFGHHGGVGGRGRENTTEIYIMEGKTYDRADLPDSVVPSRMCHTITDLGDGISLLVGGRTSPDHGLIDCWLHRNRAWQRVENLPVPLYRHSATAVELDQEEKAVLIFGGRKNCKEASDCWYMWRDATGWVQLSTNNKIIKARFGGTMAAILPKAGIMFGGMAEDGTILQDFTRWRIVQTGSNCSLLIEDNASSAVPDTMPRSICRFGSTMTPFSEGFLMFGGVASDDAGNDSSCFYFPKPSRLYNEVEQADVVLLQIPFNECGQRPLLVGHSLYRFEGSLAICGGGSNCFSFGTYWNRCVWTIRPADEHGERVWVLNEPPLDEGKRPSEQLDHTNMNNFRGPGSSDFPKPGGIVQVQINSKREFERVLLNSTPVKIERLNLGPCTQDWSFDVLRTKVGGDRPVIVHEAYEQHMSFQAKNFKYTTIPFGKFLDEISKGSQQYLRSLSAEQPSDRPAQFTLDFPALAGDFKLPAELEYVSQNMHSSPLRISGRVTMWLHYDVMANILCQIQGSKRIILYPPSDVVHLKIPPGESSSPIRIFDVEHPSQPSLARTHPLETVLWPGDVIFIPPLWSHATAPLDLTSVSINVFFRNLQSGYAAGRDVYGNRDVQAYEKGRKDLAKIAQSFDHLPASMSRFYLERLADELRDRALATVAP